MNIVKTLVFLCALLVWTNAHAVDATVTFVDTSSNETGFKVERNLNGGTWTALTPNLNANVTSVLDTTLVQSATADNKYCYRVLAFNSGGNSAYANTATPGTTDCKTVAQAVVIPSAPASLLVQ